MDIALLFRKIRSPVLSYSTTTTLLVCCVLCLMFVVESASCFLLHRAQFHNIRRTATRGNNCKKFLNMSSKLIGKPFVSIEECIEAKKETPSSLTFVDGSWWLGKVRDARAEYEAGPRIAGAKFFDIDDIATKGETWNPKGLPHMAPPKRLFAAAMDALGITNSDHVIVYGAEGCMTSSRAYYTFKSMGHDPNKVHLLQGSLKEWEEKGGPLETGCATTILADELDVSKEPMYQASDARGFCDMSKVLDVVHKANDADSIILDARSAGRFQATEPEPRAGLRGGHMPGAVNLPFNSLLRGPEDWTKFKSDEELKAVFDAAGVDVDSEKLLICSCGSGVTAAVIAVALEKCGRDLSKTVIYDGSWIEWGGDSDTPIVS